MNGWPIFAIIIASVAIMTAGWLRERATRNAGLVDVLWSACMAASALFLAATGSGALLPRGLVALLGGLWGLRLALHLARRVVGAPEDGRYRYLRTHWNDSQAKFFAFFMAQAVSIALYSLPFWIAASNPVTSWTPWTVLGVLTWLIALGGESLADHQLAKFRSEPANNGKTCRAGLWRYSRHPNYFFEWLHWFTYVFLAIGSGPMLIGLSLIGPALMLVSLVWITGIPYTEAQAVRSRGDDYRRYQRSTSVLIPWFLKEEHE